MMVATWKTFYEKLKTQGVTIDCLWDCYTIKRPGKVRGKSTVHHLANLMSIIRFEMGHGDNLQPLG